MPQASDDLRDLMKLIHKNDGVSDAEPIKYLEDRGYKLTKRWDWIVPKDHHITEKEELCIRFLRDEWDFGGVR